MAYLWQAVDAIEPISDSTIEGIANIALYNYVSGATSSYGAGSMVKTIAAGVVTHNGTTTAVAGNTVTLVSDATNPRWTWTGVNSSGVAVIVSGDPAVAPAVPELGDSVGLDLDLIQANQTIADSIVTKINKRVTAISSTVTVVGSASTPTSTTSTSAVDLVTISGLNILVTQNIRIINNYRKQALAAQATGLGLKINSTVVIEATVSAFGTTSANNRAEDGIAVIEISPRSSANYLTGVQTQWTANVSSSGANSTWNGGTSLTNPMPNATITSLAIRAINGTTSNAVEVTSVKVMTY